MNGIIILDKDTNIFSRTASWRVAKLFGERKFGHIGTLDEMASGVLPIAIGNATKMIPFIEEITENKKEYLFGLKFGSETDSLDLAGNITALSDTIPSDTEIQQACEKIANSETQIPPIFSAIHINGKRAYELARNGTSADLPARPIKIYELEYCGQSDKEYHFRVVCSRGTYVRAIVRDIAHFNNACATTTYIKRTLTNGFSIKNAVKLDFLENLVNNGKSIDEYLMQSDCALGDIPVINLADEEATLYKHGGFIKTGENAGLRRVYCGKDFIGIGRIQDSTLAPKRTL